MTILLLTQQYHIGGDTPSDVNLAICVSFRNEHHLEIWELMNITIKLTKSWW